MCRRRWKNLWLRAKNRFKIACVCSFFFFAQWEIDESHAGIFGREITFVSFLHNVKQKKKNHPLLISSMSWSRNSITLHKKTLRRCLLMTVFLCSVCVLASVVRTQRQRLFVFRSHDHWAQRTYNKKKSGEYIFVMSRCGNGDGHQINLKYMLLYLHFGSVYSMRVHLTEFCWRCTTMLASPMVALAHVRYSPLCERTRAYENVYIFFRWFRHYWLISVNGNTLLFVW